MLAGGSSKVSTGNRHMKWKVSQPNIHPTKPKLLVKENISEGKVTAKNIVKVKNVIRKTHDYPKGTQFP